MIKKIIPTATLFFIMVFTVFSVPFELDTQGILWNATTGDFINGKHSVNVSFYKDSDDSYVYSDQKVLDFDNGTYSMYVGLDTGTYFAEDLYMRIKVGTNSQLPRINLTSVPYALYCDMAWNVTWDNVLNKPENLVNKTYLSEQGFYNSQDNITTNTTTDILNVVYPLGYYFSQDNITTNTTTDIWNVCYNGTFIAIGNKTGNTTTEIRQQFTGSNNITISNGQISVNISLSTGGSNTSKDMQNAINTSDLYQIKVNCSNVYFNNGYGSSGICDGVDSTGGGWQPMGHFNKSLFI